MAFIDGENFTIRAQEFASANAFKLVPGVYYERDTFVWLPGVKGTRIVTAPEMYRVQGNAIRSYYYTSVQGDSDKLADVRGRLWDLRFAPRVFQKLSGTKSKGVDITLTLDMLSHAFQDHYDVAVVLAGDGDYAPLVEQVKRFGKSVILRFFDRVSGLNPALRLAADEYVPLDDEFSVRWNYALARKEAETGLTEKP